jgi:hypothetical protein
MNITDTLAAKSDQLNAVDIIGAEPVIKVRAVTVGKGEQPIAIFFDGDNNRPWKPSKGMRRILAAGWGLESESWIGKSAKIFYEPSVIYAGQEVGGVRIRALSDIPAAGLSCALTISRTKRQSYHVPLLVVEVKPYPADKFNKALPAMVKAMNEGQSLQQVIAQCQKTGTLNPEQLAQLEKAAPIETNEEEIM